MLIKRTVVSAAMAALLLGSAAARADAPILHETEGTFEDVAAAVEDAIVNAGLVIDNTSHVGDMLARTKADVGGAKDIFTKADIFTFCSATVSRTVMERDPQNIRFCPYGIFVYELADAPGKIVVGHQDHAANGMPEVQELLDGIVKSALMLD